MRTSAPPLLPLFRSAGQARILSRLFLEEAEGVSLSELAADVGLAKSRVSTELTRLEQAGLVESRRRGNSRIVRANPDSLYYPEVRSLILKAFGPATVLSRRLREIPGIEEAYVHGSWAARYLGEPGEQPGDVDLVVIGSPDVRSVRRAAREAGEELHREVNSTVLARDEWDGEDGAFVRTIRRRPLVRLPVEADG
jgi:DNA-binding transcriptional ArsR family regulator